MFCIFSSCVRRATSTAIAHGWCWHLLSDKLNQDPLEKHFGMVRSGGGVSDNPTQERFGQMNRKIVLVKSDMILVTRGNTRGRVWENVAIDIHDKRQLPERPKKIWIRLHLPRPLCQILLNGRWRMIKYSNYVNIVEKGLEFLES